MARNIVGFTYECWCEKSEGEDRSTNGTNDEEERKKDDKSKAIKEEVLCKDIRKRALDNLTPSISDENLKKMPKKSASVMSFLKEKAELERQSKEDELALRREQFNLEKERFEIEKQERLQKLEMEKQQSKLMFELFSKCLNK